MVESINTAEALARWATTFLPEAEDLALARRALRDSVAVGRAARTQPQARHAEMLGPAGREAMLIQLLDYDDLHLASTSHISSVCVPAAFAGEGGVRAARLAADGAQADPDALDEWLGLLGAKAAPFPAAPVVPGGLAIRKFPCSYALQRPIDATLKALQGGAVSAGIAETITVRMSEDALRPLIDARPRTGLEGKFSLEYGVATAVLDGRPGLWSFSDEAVFRPAARELLERVRVEPAPGGGGLLSGRVEVEVQTTAGRVLRGCSIVPPGAPANPLDEAGLLEKLSDFVGAEADSIGALDWDDAGAPSPVLVSGAHA